MTLGRRLDNPDGGFAGDVHVTVALDYFTRSFAALRLGPRGSVSLWGDGPTMLARYAPDGGFMDDAASVVASRELLDLITSGATAGPYHARSGADGVERTYAFRRVGGHPLYLVVGMADDDYLADWRRQAWQMAGLTGLFIVATVAVAWILRRAWRQRLAYTAVLEMAKEQAEAAWHRSDLVLSSVGEGICGIDRSGRITFINPAARSMFGWLGDAGIGLGLHEQVHHHRADGSERSEADCPVQQTLDDGQPRHVTEDVYWRRDGTSFPVEYTVAAIRRDGQILGAVNVFRDIAERQRAAVLTARNAAVTATLGDILRLALEDLDLDQILQRALGQVLSVAWFQLEPRGCVFLADRPGGGLRMAAQVNLSADTRERCATVGLGQCLCGRAALVGETVFAECVDECHATHGGDMPDHGHYCVPITNGLAVIGVLNTHVPRGHRRDGDEERFLRMVADTLAGIIRRKRLELDLTRSNEELERFAYVASHDLREPLRMVAGYVGLLGKRLAGRLNDDEATFMNFATDGARRMDRMIIDLLDYSRIGRDDAATEPVALDQVLAGAIGNLRPAIDDAGALVTVAPALPVVRGHDSQLVRLFQNLIGNAIKFHAAGRPPEVRVGCREMPGEWIIGVTDNGIGIAPEDHDRLFKVFQRLVGPDQYEGTGIGLAASRKIAEQHGGRIWVESVPGQGSTFRVALPKMAT